MSGPRSRVSLLSALIHGSLLLSVHTTCFAREPGPEGDEEREQHEQSWKHSGDLDHLDYLATLGGWLVFVPARDSAREFPGKEGLGTAFGGFLEQRLVSSLGLAAGGRGGIAGGSHWDFERKETVTGMQLYGEGGVGFSTDTYFKSEYRRPHPECLGWCEVHGWRARHVIVNTLLLGVVYWNIGDIGYDYFAPAARYWFEFHGTRAGAELVRLGGIAAVRNGGVSWGADLAYHPFTTVGLSAQYFRAPDALSVFALSLLLGVDLNEGVWAEPDYGGRPSRF